MQKNFKHLKNIAANRIGVTQQKQFGIVRSTTHYQLRKVDLKYYKREKTPKYQLKQVYKKCRKMRHQPASLSLMMENI